MHKARSIPYGNLVLGLEAARSAGLVSRRADEATGLHLYVYSNKCVYEDGWNAYSLLARGLIIDPASERVVATPFPKFFNLGERHGVVPEEPFEAYEKLDGSLIIVFHHAGQWRTATKGAFNSEQARWAQARLGEVDQSALTPGTTYLFEAVYPENRIVVHYDEPAMVMLAAYAEDGAELSYAQVLATVEGLGWRAARRYAYATIAEMMEKTATLPANDEGFVIRFASGLRLKLKGAEYRRIHALISRCTPLAMWEALSAGDDLGAIRRDLPEEFWGDFDQIVARLRAQIAEREAQVASVAAELSNLSDKDVGLRLKSLPPEVQPFIFGYRKAGAIDGKQRASLMRAIRPTGNVLTGYTPSYAMNRAMDEAA